MTTAQDLMAPMIKRRLYAIVSTVLEGKDIGPVLPDHLQYLIALEADGKVFASGPFTDEDGVPMGDGLTIVRAASQAEAQAIADDDPFVRAGIREAKVRPWTLMEGRIGTTVDLSRGTFQFL